MTINKYSPSMRLLHWAMAIVIIGLMAVGIYMSDLDDSPGKFDIYNWHKSFGVIALLLIAARIVVRTKSAVPALPKVLSKVEQVAAHWGHRALYLLMVLMPVSGYVMSAAHPKRYGVSFFGQKLPDLPPSEFWAGLAHQIHGIASYALLAVIVLHILGALKHRFFDNAEADVMVRMLP